FHRRDFGHMDFEMTLEDPKTFTKPITFKADKTLVADTELLETICEYEQHARTWWAGTDSGLLGRRSPSMPGLTSSRPDAKPLSPSMVTCWSCVLARRGM